MSLVPRKSRSGVVVYWIVHTWRARRVWERVGTVKRDAEALDKKRKLEIKNATFQPKQSARITVGSFIESWAAGRTSVNAEREMRLLDHHIVNRAGFCEIPMSALRTPDILRLIASLKTSVSDKTGRVLSPKHVANIYGLVRSAMRHARAHEIIYSDPCEPIKAGLTPKGKKAHPIYSVDEIASFLGEAVEPDVRMWNALMFFTGMRTGEVCGRKWSDYDRRSEPMGALDITSQYNDRKLKTDKIRKAPVHQELASALDWWWREGFEFVYGRKPRLDDYIVPHRDRRGEHPHTESSAYKQWLRACAQARVPNRQGKHTGRHTFVTMAQRGGAAKERVRLITHNPKGDMIDQYTQRDWVPLCEAVGSLTNSLRGVSVSLRISVPEEGVEPPPYRAELDTLGNSREKLSSRSTANSRAIVRTEADRSASLRFREQTQALISRELSNRLFRMQSHAWFARRAA